MFEIGDQVVYGIHGVCRVTGHEIKEVDRKKVTYLVLEPETRDGSRYLVPTHNAAAMAKLSPMLSCAEMEQLLGGESVRRDVWIGDENLRKKAYRELISGGQRADLMAMVHSLYRHRKSQQAAGRKCHLCDENFLRDAEKLLAGEIAAVMSMDSAAARQYLRQSLDTE